MDFEKVFANLRNQRKVFCSEKDFQFALAWEIQQFYTKATVRLEYCPSPGKNIHIDIVVELNNKMYPIELKYKTKAFTAEINNEPYYLKNQYAHNFGKYDYLKDIVGK
ncbi:hypothetical protein FACS189461_4560 [Spirochaetia bacterium]|nr:hypothetical protein FACS189461_4560 [Spirochaetia bacterium]